MLQFSSKVIFLASDPHDDLKRYCFTTPVVTLGWPSGWHATRDIKSVTMPQQILQISFFSSNPFLGSMYDNQKITPSQKAGQKRNVSTLTND